MQEPAKSREDRRGGTFTHGMKRDERGRRIVCIGNAAGMRGPRPSSRFRAGEGMERLGLMRDQERAETVFLLIVQMGRERADGKGRDPLAQVAVNRPRAVFPLCFKQKANGTMGDRMIRQFRRAETDRDKPRQGSGL